MNGITNPFQNRRLLGLLTTLSTLSALVGCSAQKPLGQWQSAMEKHVQAEGAGDPAVLRENVYARARTAVRPNQIKFARLDIAASGLPLLSPRWDAHGLLVGVATVRNRPWYVFVVGLIQRHPASAAGLDDLRLAAYTPDDRRGRWAVAAEDADAMAVYLTAGESPASDQGKVFPAAWDVFDLEVRGDLIAVRERRSGARWTLSLNDGRPVQTASALVTAH
jgi:hypothetical protein